MAAKLQYLQEPSARLKACAPYQKLLSPPGIIHFQRQPWDSLLMGWHLKTELCQIVPASTTLSHPPWTPCLRIRDHEVYAYSDDKD